MIKLNLNDLIELVELQVRSGDERIGLLVHVVENRAHLESERNAAKLHFIESLYSKIRVNPKSKRAITNAERYAITKRKRREND